jgi:hypothetical protein
MRKFLLRPPKNPKIPSMLSLVCMILYNPKWTLILEDKFPLSGNAKRSKASKEKKGFMQEDGIITSETS